MAALLVLVAIVIAVWRLTSLPRGRSIAARHPAEAMDPVEAEAVGSALTRQKRFHESLPYYRRIVEGYGTVWLAHANYSSALHNAAQESHVHLGRLEPAARSSVERMDLMAVALREQDLAELHASSASERALAHFQHGQTLQTWGFPLEALVEYEEAWTLDPGNATVRVVRGRLSALLSRGGVE